MRPRSRRTLSITSALAVLALATPLRAQCLDWKSGFAATGMNEFVYTATVYDVGSGPRLFAGGGFNVAGGTSASRVAMSDGTQWASLGCAVSGLVYSVAGFDDGSGPALFIGGSFTTAGCADAPYIAKWNGSAWSVPGGGMDGNVFVLRVLDDGSGPALYAAGSFVHASGVIAPSIAKWNGSSWSAIGNTLGGQVYALEIFDDGSGPALYAAGSFSLVGSDSANNIAKWNGSTWSALGNGLSDYARSLCVFDDGPGGNGPALYAGGHFTEASGISANHIARWNGSSWSSVGGGTNDDVNALVVYDDGPGGPGGNGPALHAGGYFTAAGGVDAKRVAKWNGSAWSSVGSGMSGNSDRVFGLAVDESTSPPLLYACGDFLTVGSVGANRIAAWNGTQWRAPVESQGIYGSVSATALFDAGSGPMMCAAGSFTTAGTAAANRVAQWNGATWSALGAGFDDSVFALCALDSSTGPALYAGGSFANVGGVSASGVARWNGASWSPLGNGIDGGTVYALAAFDDGPGGPGGSGPALYAAGAFVSVSGMSANRIAKWDGAHWSPLGSGLIGVVAALCVFDDGAGAALYAAGTFAVAGGSAANNIAKWNGSSWSALGSGITGSAPSVGALAVFDDGRGPALYVGGHFTEAGGKSASNIARWDGHAWSSAGAGFDGDVASLAAFDAGSGPMLCAAGNFHFAGATGVERIAAWNGATWSAFDSGIDGPVSTLCVFDGDADGTPDLYAGGAFSHAGGIVSTNIAEWKGCGEPGERVCLGDGTATACPCGNNGTAGHGCQNSASTGGAILDASGWSSLAHDSLVLTSSRELPSALSVFLQGTSEVASLSFGDGLRCAGGHLRRLYTKSASVGSVSAPTLGDLSITARSATLGDVIAIGTTRIYQVYYRDPSPAFCPSPAGNTWNVSSGLRIAWLR